MGANLLPVPGRTLRRSRRIDRVNQLTQAAKSAANRRENQPAQVESFESIVFFSWRNALDNFARQPNGESAIFYSMPQSHRHAYIFDRESPRLRVDLCIDHYSFRRAAPGTPLALENRFKSCVVAQAGRVARAQEQHLQNQRTKPDWRAERQ